MMRTIHPHIFMQGCMISNVVDVLTDPCGNGWECKSEVCLISMEGKIDNPTIFSQFRPQTWHFKRRKGLS